MSDAHGTFFAGMLVGVILLGTVQAIAYGVETSNPANDMQAFKIPSPHVANGPPLRPFDHIPNLGNGGLPPIDMRGDASVIVHFVDPKMANIYCGTWNAVACYKHKGVNPDAIYMPNPCAYAQTDAYFQTDNDTSYQDTLCHELGHVNGWRHKDNAS